MSDLTKLLQKVAHLRELARRAGTQAEAETAAALADQIIAQYRLTEADLELSGAAPEETVEQAAEPLDEGRHLSQRWRLHLVAMLARHYGCYAFRRRRSGTYTFQIFGRTSDVAILRAMYAWITLEIERLAKREQGRADKNAFRIGAVSGFIRALAASTQAETAKASGSVALVLVDRAKQSETLAKANGKIKQVVSSTRGSLDAFRRGQAAGDNLGRGSKQLAGAGNRLLGS